MSYGILMAAELIILFSMLLAFLRDGVQMVIIRFLRGRMIRLIMLISLCSGFMLTGADRIPAVIIVLVSGWMRIRMFCWCAMTERVRGVMLRCPVSGIMGQQSVFLILNWMLLLFLVLLGRHVRNMSISGPMIRLGITGRLMIVGL